MKNLLAEDAIKNPALGTLQTKSGVVFFKSLLPSLAGIAFVIGSLVFFFIMILGAIEWISSGGDKARLEGARGKITNALTGFIILLVIFAIAKVIENFFKINILILDIEPLIIR